MLRQAQQLLRSARVSGSARPDLAATTRRVFHVFASKRVNEKLQHSTDPYSYTTGHWLNNDKLHREARHVKFDFAALCAKAVNVCTGATKVIRYEKKEGGFNRVFLLCLDNGSRVVARVPYRISGPRRLTTNSEVATMTYVRSFTKIPVPKVLDWSDDDISIGTEYIIMEHAPGVQLHGKWLSMSPQQHMLCVKNVSFMMAEMAMLPFPIYGSLYFADAPIDPNLKSDFAEGYCIGPHCGTQYWDCNVGEARSYQEKPPNRGPWNNLQSYCSGLIDAGFSRIPKVDDPQGKPSYFGSVQEHLRLLDISRKVIRELAQSSVIESVASPTLLHPDIHKRNIFVSEEDPTCVTAIIDWQSTSIEPAFVYANQTPDLVDDPNANTTVLQQLMSAEDEPLDVEPSEEALMKQSEEEKARKIQEEDISTCRKTFEVVLLGYAQKLHNARAMDETLLRPFRYCDASWRDSATALRQELIEVLQQWSALGLPGDCPYQPTPEELAEHANQHEDFEAAQKLKFFLKTALNSDSDGWVPADEWDAKKADNTELFGHWVQSAKATGENEDYARAFWPFGEFSTLQKDDTTISDSP